MASLYLNIKIKILFKKGIEDVLTLNRLGLKY